MTQPANPKQAKKLVSYQLEKRITHKAHEKKNPNSYLYKISPKAETILLIYIIILNHSMDLKFEPTTIEMLEA